MNPLFYPAKDIRSRDGNVVAQPQRSGNEAIELSAWRFLASHRVGTLAVSHVQFIDGDECRMNTPSSAEFYESAGGATFGEAAINLAIALGMPCPSEYQEALRVSETDSSSASTASLTSGASAKTSRRTRRGSVGSTTDVTGVEASADESVTEGRRSNPRRSRKPSTSSPSNADSERMNAADPGTT